MKWDKIGKIFDPSGRKKWMASFAQNPNALKLEDRLRIYFTCRPKPDKQGQIAYTSYADFENKEPFKLINVASDPILELGGPGDFDEFGIMPGSIIKHPIKNEVWCYYVGWTRLTTVPYKWQVGLAISKDGGKTFHRYSKGPLFGPEKFDPYLQACPRVFLLDDNTWLMFYNSGTKWNKIGDKYESVYITRKATSKDGINWKRHEPAALPLKVEDECQTSASLFRYNNRWNVVYSYRYGVNFRNKERGYRIGLSISDDLQNWKRVDEALNFYTSEQGWDSEMVCYPHVFTLNQKTYMLYCGNNFGKKGFGIAKLIQG